MSIVTMFAQLGAHLKNMRKLHVAREHARLASDASHNRRLLLTNSGDPAYSTSDTEESAAYTQDGEFHADSLAPGLQDLFIAYRDGIQDPTSWFGVVASELALDLENLGDPIEYLYDEALEALTGEIAISKRTGPLGELHAEMERQGYVVVGNVVTAGSIVAKSANTGDLETTEVGADSFFPNCPTGTLKLVCTDPSISSPKFSVVIAIAGASLLADGTASLESENELQAEQPFMDGRLGLNGVVFSRPGLAAPGEFNDDANLVASLSVEDPQDDDCDEGKFYFVIARDAANWIVQIYRSSARLAGDLVGQDYFAIGAGTEARSIPCGAGTTVNYTFSHTNALVEFPDTQTGEEIDLYIDIGHFAEGDEFSIALTNAEGGKISTKTMHAWRAHFPFGPAKPASACTDNLSGTGAGNVDNGSYTYVVSYVSLLGESGQGPASGGVTVTDKTVDGKVALTAIPTGPAGTTARKIYRNNGSSGYLLLTTISDNVTTTYTDNTAQASLGVAVAKVEIDEDYATSVQMD